MSATAPSPKIVAPEIPSTSRYMLPRGLNYGLVISNHLIDYKPHLGVQGLDDHYLQNIGFLALGFEKSPQVHEGHEFIAIRKDPTRPEFRQFRLRYFYAPFDGRKWKNEEFVADSNQQSLDDSERKRDIERNRGAPAFRGFELDAATKRIDLSLDDIHTDTPARDGRDYLCRGESWREYKLEKLLVWDFETEWDEAMFHGLLSDCLGIETLPII